VEWGRNGGTRCPECGGVVRPYWPHKRVVAIVSALLGILAMKLVGVRSWVLLVLGAALLWVPISLILNSLLGWRKPLKLEGAAPRNTEPEPFIRLFDNRHK